MFIPSLLLREHRTRQPHQSDPDDEGGGQVVGNEMRAPCLLAEREQKSDSRTAGQSQTGAQRRRSAKQEVAEHERETRRRMRAREASCTWQRGGAGSEDGDVGAVAAESLQVPGA